MLIGPIYATPTKILNVVLINLGPGADQGKAWEYGASTPAWATYDGKSYENFRAALIESTFSEEAWSLYYASVPSAIPSSQRCKAVVIDTADMSEVAIIDVNDPGRLAIGEHRVIAPSNVFRLGKRADGTTVAINSIRIRHGEIMACAFDISRLTRTLVASVADIASDMSEELAVTRLNDESVLGYQAKFEADATNADPPANYTITCTITTDEGDCIKAKGTIECRE